MRECSVLSFSSQAFCLRHDLLMAQKSGAVRVRHVFTDVDNTLVAYGGGAPIPGGVRFLHELRADMDDAPVARHAPKVTILSARPNMKGLTDSAPRLLSVDGECIHGETLYGKPHKVFHTSLSAFACTVSIGQRLRQLEVVRQQSS